MSRPLWFRVAGLPAPQGSKRYLGRNMIVESSNRVEPWRADVRDAALTKLCNGDYAHLREAPLFVDLSFTLPRPKSHYGTGRNADRLRDNAPSRPAGRPDLDKLARAILDALTNVVWRDDSQIVDLHLAKSYTAEGPGCLVQVMEVV